MTQQDYYEIIGVSKSADKKEIRNAYRDLAFKYHPDRSNGNHQNTDQNADKMKAINEAYAVLSDPAKRQQYDSMRRQYGQQAYTRFRQGYSERDIFHGSDILEIFEELARGSGLRGFDEIFKDLYGPGMKIFRFGGGNAQGSGFVFRGGSVPKGHPFTPSRPSSTLGKLSGYLLKKMIESKFPTNGDNLESTLELTSQEMRQGGSNTFHERLRNKKLLIQVPPGIREGQKIRLAGMGKPGKKGGQAGDLYLTIKLKKTMVEKVKSLLKNIKTKVEA